MRSAALATPKSITRGPSGATSTLDGFRSRCTSPALWIDSSASAHPAASHRVAGTGSGPVVRTSSVSDGAGTYAVASHGMSASGSAAMTAAVKTPLTRRAAATSWANLTRKPASSANSILIVLTATSRPAVERPRNTWPMAPAPRRPSNAYGPICSGSHRRSGCIVGCANMCVPPLDPSRSGHYDADFREACALVIPVLGRMPRPAVSRSSRTRAVGSQTPLACYDRDQLLPFQCMISVRGWPDAVEYSPTAQALVAE